jgi:hypothetical protein
VSLHSLKVSVTSSDLDEVSYERVWKPPGPIEEIIAAPESGQKKGLSDLNLGGLFWHMPLGIV